MANLTIALDEDLLRRARVKAAERGTSVNAVLREYLDGWVARRSANARAVAALVEQSRRATSGRRGRRWGREDLHDR